MKGRVLFVGPLPPPIGGVSSHVARLSSFLNANGVSCVVLDMYADCKKVIIPGVVHKICPIKGRFLSLIWLFFYMQRGENNIVHIHFSRIIGRVLICALIPKKRSRRLILTLHDGDQATVFLNASWLLRLLAVSALSRMDLVVALSNEQYIFYQSLGVPVDRLVRWEVALPLTITPDTGLVPVELGELFPVEAGGEETILMTSGYPEDSYGYEECVELLDRLSERIPCKLIVSLYGSGRDSVYERKLRIALLQHPNVILVGPLPAAGFLALLAKASAYLRPSKIDSYGLAITDALNMGTPCLASDVCKRDPRCQTFSVGDRDAFIRQASDLVEQGRKLRSKKAYGQIDSANFDVIKKCYK